MDEWKRVDEQRAPPKVLRLMLVESLCLSAAAHDLTVSA